MQFRSKLTKDEIKENSLGNESIEWYWMTVDAYDLKNNVHIYINKPNPDGSPVGWQKISSTTCLGEYAKVLLNINFNFDKDPQVQTHILQIKRMAENLDYAKLTEKPWQYFAKRKGGPFMIRDAVHRQLAAYIHYFIWNPSKEFKPVENAVCGLPITMREDFEIIPESFCQ